MRLKDAEVVQLLGDFIELLSLLPLLPLAKGQFEQSKGNTELNRAAFTQEHVPYP